MAIFHLNVRPVTRAQGDRAGRRARAVMGLGPTRERPVISTQESGNLPTWAETDPLKLWNEADNWERANARLALEIDGALPREIDEGARARAVRTFIDEIAGDRLPYVWTLRPDAATPGPTGPNPHFRALLMERANDGLPRTARQWFRRANPKRPGQGGAAKDRRLKGHDWLHAIRGRWAELLNAELVEAGESARVSAASRRDERLAAEAAGDAETAGSLLRKRTGRHIGMAATHIERGRHGRPGRPSERADAERARQRAHDAKVTELDAVEAEIEALRKAT